MIEINYQLQPGDLLAKLATFWAASAECIDSIEESCPPGSASPVFTVDGRYAAKGWTEWTQGFQYGCAILVGDALQDQKLIDLGKRRTIDHMLTHVTHVGVHDHGFNNLSTYGHLLLVMDEGRIAENEWQRRSY